MNLEKRTTEAEYESDRVAYIHPLETVVITREFDFNPTAVPTEQGELLLEFLKRQLFK